MGNGGVTALLDTHVVHWSSAEPERLSRRAVETLLGADELAVSAISWYELAWLARRQRIAIRTPIPAWLDQLAADVRTIGISPAVAAAAALLPDSFPRDPVDRVIYAT